MDLLYTLRSDHPTQLGMIVLQSDETLEADMRRLLPVEAELLVSRVESGTELSHDMIAAMEDRLTASARLLPRDSRFAAVGYGCTSASAQIGSDRVAARIKDGAQVAHVTNPVAALIAACRALEITKLGLVSPYIASISDRLREVLEEAGITVTRFGSFNEPVEANVVRITEGSLEEAAMAVGAEDACQAVFLSCTNLRTLDVIPRIEAQLGKPVLSSNQVLAWHLLQLADIAPVPGAPGALWDKSGSRE